MRNCYAITIDKPVSYSEGLEMQQRAYDLVLENQIDGIILLLQHKPVFTTGSNGGTENLLITKEELNELGIDLYETNRGGNITYHGPGQLVVYPILDLSKFQKDVHWYLRQLEEVMIKTLSTYGITARRKQKYPGVWVGEKKITAIGVHVKKWITTHGLAFNISVNKEHFGLINPCGIVEYGIASLDDFFKEIEYSNALNKVKEKLMECFDMELTDTTLEELEQ